MARMLFKNTFGSQNSRLDLQRQDLFKFTINLPQAIGTISGKAPGGVPGAG